MRVLFLTGREVEYARNQVLLAAFERFADVDVVARTQKPGSLLANSAAITAQAAPLLLRNPYDLVFVGFYGHLIMRMIAPLVRSPLLFDAFVSTYDTLCFDRQLYAPDSPMGRAAFSLDRATARQADRVLLDTQSHVAYFVETFSVAAERFRAVPVGCSDAIFTPAPLPPPRTQLEVLSYSTFLPLHGMDVILHAAAQVQDEPLRFRFIGDGPAYGEIVALADQLGLRNVRFDRPVPPVELAACIAEADLCLGGHFYAGGKAGRVVPGKIYQMLAVGRPVIAADAPGNRELLTHGESAYFVPPADPTALAAALRTLAHDEGQRHALAHAGRARYVTAASETVITRQLRQIVNEMLAT